MNVKDFDYHLPEHLIAQHPLKDRTASRLLVLDRTTGDIRDEMFTQFIDYLHPGDVLVLNDSKVIPARLFGSKIETGGAIEMVLLRDLGDQYYETLVKKARTVRKGTRLTFGDGALIAECVEVCDEGIRIMKLHYEGVLLTLLDQLGTMPLPPYIKAKLDEPERYQTVYSKHAGSAAAPTAGLHFTQNYLQKIRDKGVVIVPVTLHVGLGTFRPVSVEKVEDHTMHAEYYTMPNETAAIINQAKQEKRRIVAVGTTSMRTLETCAFENGVKAQSGMSDIFITPGFRFQVVDALLTNFHLPKSTLLMLVSAFASREHIFNAYHHAIKHAYRFFSFGDAMFLTDLKK